MLNFIGDNFPAVVVVGMLVFMIVLGGVSVSEALRSRRP